MKRILKLTESDLVRIIGKIINEQPDVDFLVKKSHNKIDELEFTEEDYFNYKECRRKKRTFPNYNPTEEEKVAYNKYFRQMAKGLDPAGPFKGKGRKEEPFTEEEYFNYKEYKRKKRTSPNYNPTEEERVAYNKYYRQKLKGLDAIAPFRKQENPHIMEKIMKQTLSEEIQRTKELMGIIIESSEEEAWELVGQENPVIFKIVSNAGYNNDEESVKKLIPIIDGLPEKEFTYEDIKNFKNLENRTNDEGLVNLMKKISNTKNPRKRYEFFMKKRDSGEKRPRGYNPVENFDRIVSGNYEPPLVLQVGGKYYVVGGRTRLYASIASNTPIKIKILKTNYL